jgi:hypothetical protein
LTTLIAAEYLTQKQTKLMQYLYQGTMLYFRDAGIVANKKRIPAIGKQSRKIPPIKFFFISLKEKFAAQQLSLKMNSASLYFITR